MGRSASTCSPSPRPGIESDHAGPCAGCHRRAGCKTPCRRLEKLLPGPRRAEQYLPVPPELADTCGEWRREVGQSRRELFRIFLRLRDRLTAAQWRCVDLHYGEDLGVRAVARRLGVSAPTVKQHLDAARRRAANGRH
jgi:DNA-directed RNA polymerase specialized sigma24 family protein